MNSIKSKITTALLEGLIPILGYFVWDWNVYFVMVFYLFDFLLQQVMFNLKLNKTIFKPGYFNGVDDNLKSIYRTTTIKHILVGLITLCVLALSAYSISTSTIKGFSVLEESSSFFWYREMGIPQGFLLIPLFIFAGYAFYKMKFLMPKLYITLKHESMTKQYMSSMLVLIAFSGILLATSYFLDIPQAVYIIAFTVGKFLFDVFIYDRLYR